MISFRTLSFLIIALSGGIAASSASALSLSEIASRAKSHYEESQSKQDFRQASISAEMSVTQGEPNNDCPQFQIFGFPNAVREGVNERSVFMCRTGYAGQYDPAVKGSLWIAEHVTRANLKGTAVRDDLDFVPDPQLKSSAMATDKTYSRSGFDKGHLACAANFRASDQLMRESFFYTNAVPQRPDQNRVIWRNLESTVREMANRRGELFVFTGPVYAGRLATLSGGVAIPTHLYKVLIDPKTNEMTGFVIPNQNGLGSDPSVYQVSVRFIENQTGINFNPILSRANADKYELSSNWILPKTRSRLKE